MTDSKYQLFLKELAVKGVNLNAQIIQKTENGIPGMYATAPIEKGARLCTFPVSARIPEKMDKSFVSHPSATTLAKLNALVNEMANPDTAYAPFFCYFEPLESLKASNFYFFDSEELSLIHELNPNLYRCISEQKSKADFIISELHRVNPEIEIDVILGATLNWFSRAWSWGILPVIDLFNHSLHSDTQIQLLDDERSVGFIAQRDYSPGEEIFVAYGTKDMYKLAIAYSFYDPKDQHLIDYAYRVVQTLTPPFTPEVFHKLSSKYKVRIYQDSNNYKASLDEEAMLLMAQGPNARLMEYLSDLVGVISEGQGNTARATYNLLRQILQSLLSSNRVDSFREEDMPDKLKRFHQLLVKEKSMLLGLIQRIPT